MTFHIERLGNLQYIFSNLRVNKNYKKEILKNERFVPIVYFFTLFDSVRLYEV